MARKGRRKRGKSRENIYKHNRQLQKKRKKEKEASAENIINKYDYNIVRDICCYLFVIVWLRSFYWLC